MKWIRVTGIHLSAATSLERFGFFVVPDPPTASLISVICQRRPGVVLPLHLDSVLSVFLSMPVSSEAVILALQSGTIRYCLFKMIHESKEMRHK